MIHEGVAENYTMISRDFQVCDQPWQPQTLVSLGVMVRLENATTVVR